MLGKNLKNISAEVIDFFWYYSWPGNVRELEHIIESAVNMASDSDDLLKLEHCYFANLLGISDKAVASSLKISRIPVLPIRITALPCGNR